MIGRTRTGIAGLVFTLAIAALSSGCSIAPLYDEIVPARVTLGDYETLYPNTVGICAVTQYRRADGQVGGSPGHGVMTLGGACRDEQASYPRLRLCREDEAGTVTGVSVNRWFRNVNWVATDDADLFFNGGVGRRDVLDAARVQATAEAAIASGMFEGVELHDYPTEAAERSLLDFVLKESLGTDFALRFGRSIYCSTMPVERDILRDVIAYLNEQNALYAEGEADYNWSGYSDNCVHTITNALAAGGIWKSKSVRGTKLRQLFNLAVPANEMVKLGWWGTQTPLAGFDRIYGDRVLRETFEKRGWLPVRHGVLAQSAPIHQPNQVYDARSRLLVLQAPFRATTEARAQKLLNDARFTEVDVNLYYWRARYERILDRRPDPERLTLRPKHYLDLEQRYYEYIAEQIEDVDRLIEQFLNAEPPA